jgi:hypothetical protein
MDDQDVTIRGATPNDARGLRRLAELDSSTPLTGRVLLAELDGAPVAAVSLATGSATADPFQHSADAVRMLRARRYRIMRQGGDLSAARSLLLRLAPGPAH